MHLGVGDRLIPDSDLDKDILLHIIVAAVESGPNRMWHVDGITVAIPYNEAGEVYCRVSNDGTFDAIAFRNADDENRGSAFLIAQYTSSGKIEVVVDHYQDIE